MKIAFIVGGFPVISETFILNQITGLIDRGHEVDIYGYQLGNTSKLHPDVEKYQLLKRTHYVPQVPKNYLLRLLKGLGLIFANFHKSPLVLLRSLNFFKYGKRSVNLRMLYSIIPFLGVKSYDIIHCQFGLYAYCPFGDYAFEGMVLRDIGAIQGKLITSFRGYDISWYIQEYGEDVYKPLFVKGDFFLTNCNFFRKRVIKLGCDEAKIIVHGSGIDCSRFEFKPRHQSEDKIRLVTTGRLVEKKGIEYALLGIAKVIKEYPRIEYNIIGDGSLKEHLQQLIEELDIAEHVKLLGWRNQPEIIKILDKSHIFMAPSVTTRDGNQDAPVNTLKEAMAMGLPVIGTHHGGIPELIEDGISGFLVPERDDLAIANKLKYLIEHPKTWEQMGKAGRAYVESHYDMNKLNDELVEIYQQVLMNKKSEYPEKLIVTRVSPEYT
jgi:colanic acid/amylovoran biosynthesis glycosyltransferase